MKKVLTSVGLISATSAPMITTVACATSNETAYFYDLNVSIEEKELIVVLKHLPTENDMNDDFLEEYRRRIYNDLGNQIVVKNGTTKISAFTITFLSTDYEGDEETYSLTFTNDDEPLRRQFLIPEYVGENGQIVSERIFHILSFADFFREDILNHINNDALLKVSPTSGEVIEGRFTPEGYITRKLIYDFLRF